MVAADTELWYLIGACVGDGAWGSEIGVSVYPMSPVEGGKFDEATGKGPLTLQVISRLNLDSRLFVFLVSGPINGELLMVILISLV